MQRADLDSKERDFLLAVEGKQQDQVARFLKGQNLKDGLIGEALYISMVKGDWRLALLLLGSDRFSKVNPDQLSDWLWIALEHCPKSEVVSLLCRVGADPNRPLPRTRTKFDTLPLHFALDVESSDDQNCEGDDGFGTSLTEALLEHGADPNLETERGISAYDEARYSYHLNAYRLFVSSHGEPRAKALSLPNWNNVQEHCGSAERQCLIVSRQPGRSGKDSVMTSDDSGQVFMTPLGSTDGQIWRVSPAMDLKQDESVAAVRISNSKTLKSLENPNPSGEFIGGQSPRLRADRGRVNFDAHSVSWILRERFSDGEEQVWSMSDAHHAYFASVIRSHRSVASPVGLLAWQASLNQLWVLREVS